MVPRTDIVWVEKGTRLGEFLAIYAQSSHTRFPVYEGSVDNVVGVLSIKDLLLAQARGEVNEDTVVSDLARPPYFVPTAKHIGTLFTEMQAAGNPIAIVVDELGGVAGLVTLETLVEEIVGRLGDELTGFVKSYQVIDENTFVVDGGMHIEDANEELGLGLPEGHYDTVAGFILNLLGHIPREGEQLKYNDLKVVVAEMEGVKIEKVLVTKG